MSCSLKEPFLVTERLLFHRQQSDPGSLYPCFFLPSILYAIQVPDPVPAPDSIGATSRDLLWHGSCPA
jgi:hypothetical protein